MLLTNGSRFYIGTRVAPLAAVGEAEFQAQAGEWVEIGGWTTMGQLGDEQEVVSQSGIGQARMMNAKGTRTGRVMENAFVPDPNDEGQVRLNAAAGDCATYAFKIEWPYCGDAEAIETAFFYGLVLPPSTEGGDVNAPLLLRIGIAVVSNIIATHTLFPLVIMSPSGLPYSNGSGALYQVA